MDFTALKTELASPAYAGLSIDDMLTAVNSKTVAARRPIPADEVTQFFVKNGIFAAAYFAAANTQLDMTLRAACQTLRDTIEHNAFSVFDLDNPDDKTLIDTYVGGLISAGVMTADQQTALYALADITQPWWQANNYGEPIGRGFLINAGVISQ